MVQPLDIKFLSCLGGSRTHRLTNDCLINGCLWLSLSTQTIQGIATPKARPRSSCISSLDRKLYHFNNKIASLTSFTELSIRLQTTFTIETFVDDVTSFVTRSSVKTRIAFAAAVLTVNGGSIGLKRNSRKLLDPLSTKNITSSSILGSS